LSDPRPDLAKAESIAADRAGDAAVDVASDVETAPLQVATAPAGDERSAADRAADHAEIERLATDLLPSLTAKLGATGLAEIEVREGARRIRIRQPVVEVALGGVRPADRQGRAQGGHASHAHVPGGDPPRHGHAASTGPTNGSNPNRSDLDVHRAVATSPAVGIFQPGSAARAGTRVRAGDRLGNVDMLGVPQEVIAPTDGIVGATLVESGQAVEYGQELIRIELAGVPASPGPDRG
jgi:acetyl-CoA carboxylase biotin carboxyl carrier protein